jgi:ABC-2 type transport system ATP-binding protein
MASEAAIVVSGLRKSYGSLEAVRGLEFTVARGEVFALLGPNGAGKTTTVEILEGYRERTAGEVSVLGHDPARNEGLLKQRVGVVLQETGLPQYLTVREIVAMFAGYYPAPRDVGETIALVGLEESSAVRVINLSGGQRRRLDLALALAGDPELLFLDEPTTGFDPSARRQAWETVRALTGLGKTILLTTHFMDEAENLAHRVAILNRGEIVASGSPETLGARSSDASVIRFSLPDGIEPPTGLAAHRAGAGSTWEIDTSTPTRALHELTGWAVGGGFELIGLDVSRPSLEDVYLELTGEAEEGEAVA